MLLCCWRICQLPRLRAGFGLPLQNLLFDCTAAKHNSTSKMLKQGLEVTNKARGARVSFFFYRILGLNDL